MERLILLTCLAATLQAQATPRHLYVSNEHSHDVSVIDVGTRKEIARIPMPSRPRGIQPSRDGSRVYVALSDD